MFQPHIAPAQIQDVLNTVNHQNVQDGSPQRFPADQTAIAEQSIAWLFCWAKTGQSSETAKAQSRQAFNTIFAKPNADLFRKLDEIEAFHEYARALRNKTEKDMGEDFKAQVGELLLQEFNGTFA